jgi:hypothetical protein
MIFYPRYLLHIDVGLASAKGMFLSENCTNCFIITVQIFNRYLFIEVVP